MSANALPLPLALSRPMPMVTDLDSQFKANLGAVSSMYNPETQVGVYAASRETQLAWGVEISGTQSQSNTTQNGTGNGTGNVVIDDVVVDDNNFDIH